MQHSFAIIYTELHSLLPLYNSQIETKIGKNQGQKRNRALPMKCIQTWVLHTREAPFTFSGIMSPSRHLLRSLVWPKAFHTLSKVCMSKVVLYTTRQALPKQSTVSVVLSSNSCGKRYSMLMFLVTSNCKAKTKIIGWQFYLCATTLCRGSETHDLKLPTLEN